VAEEVFVRLSRYSDAALAEHPQSYMFDIAANVVNEWRARDINSRPQDDTWLTDPQFGTENKPESSADNMLVSAQVSGAVSRMSRRQREVFLLHARDNLTYKQIAARLKLTPCVVLHDITRAYAHCAETWRDSSDL
jgi:RNA polymerase sigma-70 factor (ECF subfamily)